MTTKIYHNIQLIHSSGDGQMLKKKTIFKDSGAGSRRPRSASSLSRETLNLGVVPKLPRQPHGEEPSQPPSQQQACHSRFCSRQRGAARGTSSQPWGQQKGQGGAGQTSAALGCRWPPFQPQGGGACEQVRRKAGTVRMRSKAGPQPECSDEKVTTSFTWTPRCLIKCSAVTRRSPGGWRSAPPSQLHPGSSPVLRGPRHTDWVCASGASSPSCRRWTRPCPASQAVAWTWAVTGLGWPHLS